MSHLSLFLLLSAALLPGSARAQTDGPATRFAAQPMAVAVIVSDPEASRVFYTDVIGLRPKGGFHVDEAFGQRSGLSRGTAFDVVLLTTDTARAGLDLKLVHFADTPPRSPGAGVQARLGLQYLTLFVEDVAPVLAAARARGIVPEGETPLTLGDGRDFLLLRDPDGVYVEVIEAAAAP